MAHRLWVLLAVAGLVGGEVLHLTSDLVEQKLEELEEGGGVVVVHVADQSDYGKELKGLLAEVDKQVKETLGDKVVLGWGSVEDLVSTFDVYGVGGDLSGYGLFIITKGGRGATYKDGENVTPSLIVNWVRQQLDTREQALEHLRTATDNEFSSIVFIPSRTAVVIYDTNDVSPLAEALAKASTHFNEAVADKSLTFVRATEVRNPSRFEIPDKGLDAPVVYYYGRRKAKYSPKVYKGEPTADGLAKWIASMTGAGLIDHVKDMTIPVLTDDSFDPVLKTMKKGMLVLFYAPWCGHCKRMMPDWDRLAEQLRNEKEILIAKLDATEAKATTSRFPVGGYPTIMFITPDGKSDEYSGDRSIDSLREFAYKKLGKHVPGEEPSDAVILRDDNFADIVTNSDKAVFVKFYAPWCGHCKRMAPDWDALGKHFKDSKDVTIAKLDAQRYSVGNKYGITGFPTIMWFAKGNKEKPVKYGGARDYSTMKRYVKQQLEAPGNEKVEEKKQEGKTGGLEGTPGKVLELSDATLPVVTKGEAGQGTLVMFYATWCGHCKKLHPDYNKLAEHFKGKNVHIARYDAPKYPDLAKAAGVRSFPTIFFYDTEGYQTKFEGERSFAGLAKFVEAKL